MKKQMTALVLAFALVLTLTGCTTVSALRNPDTPAVRVERKPEENRKAPVRETAPSALQPASPKTPPALPETLPETFPGVSEPSGAITGERAQQIALDYLGFTADQVTRLRTEYEVDDGIPQFDVEFCRGDWEYEFEIHAETGRILSYDKDHRYD